MVFPLSHHIDIILTIIKHFLRGFFHKVYAYVQSNIFSYVLYVHKMLLTRHISMGILFKSIHGKRLHYEYILFAIRAHRSHMPNERLGSTRKR